MSRPAHDPQPRPHPLTAPAGPSRVRRMTDQLTLIAAISLGAVLGANARYFLNLWCARHLGTEFPWGIFLVNVTGSFLMGCVAALLAKISLPPQFGVLATVGTLGSFTTFSTYSLDGVRLLERGDWTRAAAYLGGSAILGVLAALAGLALISFLVGPES